MKFLGLVGVSFFIWSCGDGGGKSGSVPPLNRSIKVEDMPVLYANPGIFKIYSATGDSVMNSTWTRKFDASGISMNDSRTCTLVTPQHVVMAAHFMRPVPSSVVFHDRYGKRIERILVARKKVVGDCAVGLLNAPVPAGYKIYALPAHGPDVAQKLTGEFVLVTDKNRRLFVHQVAAVGRLSGSGYIKFLYDKSKQVGYGKILVTGDSGNPSFVMRDGVPVLIETHTTGGAGAGPFYGDAVVQSKLQQAIKEIGGTGKLRFKRL